MLPTLSSTPPPHDDLEVVDAHISTTPSIGWAYPSPSSSSSSSSSFAEPLSPPVTHPGHSHAPASSSVSAAPQVGISPTAHSIDEDQDMSEGGVPLSMGVDLGHALAASPDHVQQLYAEMDMLDAEIMEQTNLDELFLGANNQPATTTPETSSFLTLSMPAPPQPLLSSDDFDDDMLYDEFEPAEASTGPAAMLEVSQQLEHLQGAHEIVDFLGIAGTQHDNVADHSISPLLLPIQSPAGFDGLDGPTQEHIALLLGISISLPNPQAAGSALALQSVLHLSDNGSLIVSAELDILAPDQGDEDAVSHVNGVDMSWDDSASEADQPAVDDQFNMGLVDFLYTWGRSSSLEESSYGSAKKSGRGPTLPAILRQRSLRGLEPMVTSDLQGDMCDIQRINWNELGVSRLEAKKMRKRTYKNYTNLRLPSQWQVSSRLILLHVKFSNMSSLC